MITIYLRESQGLKVKHTICDDPTPGTWGSHQLLLREYRELDPSNRFKQMLFNYDWLKDKEIDYGPLWCVYCGKEELRISLEGEFQQGRRSNSRSFSTCI